MIPFEMKPIKYAPLYEISPFHQVSGSHIKMTSHTVIQYNICRCYENESEQKHNAVLYTVFRIHTVYLHYICRLTLNAYIGIDVPHILWLR